MQLSLRKLMPSLVMFAALGAFMAAPVSAQDPEAPSLTEVAAEDGNFTTVVTALQLAEMDDVFGDCASGDTYTMLMPTDAAFETALPALGIDVADLAVDTDLLTAILGYHVIEGVIPSEAVLGLDGASATTLQGEEVSVAVDGDTISIVSGNPIPATVVTADVVACNGVIHVIDNVLLPPTVAESLGVAAPGDQGEEEPVDEAEEAEEEPVEGADADLASTGSESPTLVIVALTLVAAGAMVVLSSRRLRLLD